MLDPQKLSKQEYYSEVYEWTICKEKIHNGSEVEKKLYKKEISIKLGQIWWYYVGINIGKEIGKTEPFTRPCIIINNNIGSGLVGIFPIYGGYKYKDRYVYKIEDYKKYGLTKESYILLNQYKTISIKRLIKKINDKDKVPLVTSIELEQMIIRFKDFF